MTKTRPKPGTVLQIDLPNGRYAYARVYGDASIGIYRVTTESPGQPPIGLRDFRFIVGAYDDVLTSGKCTVVGEDPFDAPEDEWPPERAIIDPITGTCEIYYRGSIRPALPEECDGLEIAAVWDLNHILDRIINGEDSKYLKAMRASFVKRKSTIQ